MVRHLETLFGSLLRLQPKLPVDATPETTALFSQLRILLQSPADLPHEVEALLVHWLEIEEGRTRTDEAGQSDNPWRQSFSSLPVAFGSPLLSRAITGLTTHIRNASRSFTDLETAAFEADEDILSGGLDEPPELHETPVASPAEVQAIHELRWLVQGRATLGMLLWWLMSLIDLSVRAAKART